MYRPNLQSVPLPVPEIKAIADLGWGCEPSIVGKAVGGRRWYRSKQRWRVPIGPP